MAPRRTTVDEYREVREAKLTVLAKAARLSLAQAAAAYAAAGVAVFPCVPGTKRPLTRHGFTEASADPQRIARWWRRWPEANIGVPTGRPDGFDVLDVDVHRSGSGFPALRRARQARLVDGGPRWSVARRAACICTSQARRIAAGRRGRCRARMWTSAARAGT